MKDEKIEATCLFAIEEVRTALLIYLGTETSLFASLAPLTVSGELGKHLTRRTRGDFCFLYRIRIGTVTSHAMPTCQEQLSYSAHVTGNNLKVVSHENNNFNKKLSLNKRQCFYDKS
jgi:hypothetical protein